MESTFLLISDPKESAWPQFLSEALAPLGSLRIVSEKVADAKILQAHYDLVIVDSAVVAKAGDLVSHMRAQKPCLKIVVVSLAPTWWEARAVLRAGAVDYLSRSLSKRELASAVEEVLKMPPVAQDT